MTEAHEGAVAQLWWESLADLEFPEELLELLEGCKVAARDWSSSLNDDAKSSLKAALLPGQKVQCAYCRRPVKDEPGHVEIDHILPKSARGDAAKHTSNEEADRFCTEGYPQFAFDVRNLVLTCKRCNNKKGSYDGRFDRSTAAGSIYRLEPDYYAWVHPHFDAYSSHITLYEGLIYRPVEGSAKGDALIRTCKLDSIAAVEGLARDLVSRAAPSYIDALIMIISQVNVVGWDAIADSVVQAFPEVGRETIESKVAELRKTLRE